MQAFLAKHCHTVFYPPRLHIRKVIANFVTNKKLTDMKGRISFKLGAIQHIYQRTNNGYLLFYTVKDYLVFFSIIMTVAHKYRIRILGLCFMVDHIHMLVDAPSKIELYRFIQDYTARLTTVWNKQHGQRGPLFWRQYGFASKVTGKDIRSAIAYLYNNPVEKQLCSRPEQAQWNFLAYGASKNPFSEPLRLSRASAPLRRAIKEVAATRAAGKPLSYKQLQRLSLKLSRPEQQQLADYRVRIYNCIDYMAVSSYYDGLAQMITAINTTKGGEYDIREDFTSGSDRIYYKMTQFLLESGVISNVDELLPLPQDERQALVEPLCLATGASAKKAAKYLHLIID